MWNASLHSIPRPACSTFGILATITLSTYRVGCFCFGGFAGLVEGTLISKGQSSITPQSAPENFIQSSEQGVVAKSYDSRRISQFFSQLLLVYEVLHLGRDWYVSVTDLFEKIRQLVKVSHYLFRDGGIAQLRVDDPVAVEVQEM